MSENKPSEYPFHVGEYDERMRDRVRKKTPAWEKLVKRRKGEFKEFDKFLSSAFFDLWKPTKIAVDPLTPSAEVMKKILDIAHRMPEWERLEERVKNKYGLSALAALTIGENIVFPEDPGNGGQGEGDGEDEAEGELGQGVREAIARAVRQAEQAAEDGDALSQLWGEEAGEDVANDPELLMKLLGLLKDSNRLKMVVAMLGRLRNQFYHSRMTRSEYVPEEFVDIEMGNDLNNILPYSRILLAEEDLNVLFLMKYLQRSLLQQVKESKERLNRGPIVMLIDVSGSMSASIGNVPGVGSISRVDWATAVALTMILLAKQQNREYYIATFDYYIRKELRSIDGPVTIETIVNILAVQASGGTNFERPLQRGVEEMMKSEYSRADMVFVTDGDCYVPQHFLDKFLQAKAEKQFNVIGVACEHAKPASLMLFCDKVLSAGSILDADKTTNELFSIGD